VPFGDQAAGERAGARTAGDDQDAGHAGDI
jgi:hypothetical protein